MKRADHDRSRGFTLIEVVIAMTITAMLVVSVLEVFQVSLNAREEVKALSEPMTNGPRILDMVEEDIRSLWTFNVKDNRILKGENRDFVGDDADRLHLIVTGRTIHQVRLSDDTFRPASLAEVSYLVKGNNENAQHLELWRREDPLVDDDPYHGGYFQLLSNRVRSFNITYYEDLGIDAEPFDEWDAAEKGKLPRRIKIELDIERSKDTFHTVHEIDDLGGRVDKFVRHVVLDPQTVSILEPGIALIPLVPDAHPEPENALAGGSGAGGGRGAGGRDGTDRGAGANGALRPGGGDRGARSDGNRGAGTTIPGLGRGGNTGPNLDQILRGIGSGRGNTGGNNNRGR